MGCAGGSATVGTVLILFIAPCSCSVHDAAEMADAVVEGSDRALRTGFVFEVKSVALVVGIGKDKGDAIVAGGFAGDEAQMAGGVEVGREGKVFGGEGGLHGWMGHIASKLPGSARS